MAKKIYSSDLLQIVKMQFADENEITYFILRLVAKGRKKIILCEPACLYGSFYGKHINDSIADFLECQNIDFTIHLKKPYSIYDNPILFINKPIYDENGRAISCR